MTVTLTVIVPTIGRDTLPRALASCAGADEILVVVDRARAGEAWAIDLPAYARLIEVESCNRGGHSSRNTAMPQATSTHLCFLDDDDIYLPGAIDLFRQHATDVPVVFRMDHHRHGILWRDPALRFGNVSTQMMVVPNHPDKLGVWAHHMPPLPEPGGYAEPGGDYTFLNECAENMGGVVWREEIVAKIRPHFTTISIVTPWMNHPELWQDYAHAVSVRSPRDELVIVDNASDPPVPTASVTLSTNEGFSGGSNAGLHAATGDAVLFLNNDIVLTRPDWLEAIRAAVEHGVIVGAQLRHDPHGTVDGQELPYLDGWCLAGMRADLLELGGFDEGFTEPSYYSDNDLSLRARAAGFTLREAKVGLRHLANVTAGPATDPLVARASTANRARFAERARALLQPV